jgi:hypothetical protein
MGENGMGMEGASGTSPNPRTREDLRLMQGKHDVFVSFSSLNAEAIDSVYRELAGALAPMEKRVWCSRQGLAPSNKWLNTIVKKMGEVQCFVLLLSKESLASEWVLREVQAAFRRHDTGQIQAIFCFRLDNVETDGTELELLLDPVQKVNEPVVDWRDDLPKLVECVCHALDVDPPRQPAHRRRHLRQIKSLWREASSGVKVGLLLLASMLGLGTYSLWPANIPDAPDLQAASDSQHPVRPGGPNSTDSDNVTSVADLTFEVGNIDPSAPIQLLRDGQVVNTMRAEEQARSVAIRDPGPIGPGTYVYTTRQFNRIGMVGTPSDPLQVRIVGIDEGSSQEIGGQMARDQGGIQRVAGIEVGSKSVKATLLVIEGQPGSQVRVAFEKQLPTDLTANLVDAPGGKKKFNADAIARTAEAVKQIHKAIGDEAKGDIKDIRFFLVAGSDLVDDIAVDSFKALAKAVATENDKLPRLKILTEENEVRFLFLGTVEKERRDSTLSIDIGFRNTKFGFVEQGRGNNWRTVYNSIPYGSDTLHAVAPKLKDGEQIANTPDQLKQFDEWARKFRANIPKIHSIAHELDNLAGRARDTVYLTGGIVWAMVSLERPEMEEDNLVFIDSAMIKMFERRVRSDDPFTVRTGDEQAERQARAVRSVFSRQQLLAGAEILKAISEGFNINNPTGRWKAYFCREGHFAWIRGFAEERSGARAGNASLPLDEILGQLRSLRTVQVRIASEIQGQKLITKDERNRAGRVAQGDCSPGLPQIRACGFPWEDRVVSDQFLRVARRPRSRSGKMI